MGRTNAEWHRAHRMPKNPTVEQRIAWHRAHAQNCNCREMPEGIRKLIESDRAAASPGTPVRLFSYGTLQQENVQLATFGRRLEGAADALPGYASFLLEITDPQVLATSGERFHPIVRETGNRADSVPGTVFAISEAELAAADDYEVSDYRRVLVRLASGLDAWVYVKA